MSDSLWPLGLQHQASLSLTISWSLPKFMSIALVMLSSHLILWCPLLLLPSVSPSFSVFSIELAFHIRWLNIGASTTAFPMNIQGWFPLELNGWITLLSKGLSIVFSSTTIQKHQFFSTQHLWSNFTFILDYWKNKDRSLSQSDVSAS